MIAKRAQLLMDETTYATVQQFQGIRAKIQWFFVDLKKPLSMLVFVIVASTIEKSLIKWLALNEFANEISPLISGVKDAFLDTLGGRSQSLSLRLGPYQGYNIAN